MWLLPVEPRQHSNKSEPTTVASFVGVDALVAPEIVKTKWMLASHVVCSATGLENMWKRPTEVMPKGAPVP